MPARNSEKSYVHNGYYHVYNRGVAKQDIFKDAQDYSVFLSYLESYLSPKDTDGLKAQLADPTLSGSEKDKILKRLRLKNFHKEITLLAYCLMPNHFHLFVKQKSKNSLPLFMSSLLLRYAMYFNRKYKREGHLFQDVYKASWVDTESYYIYLSAYIHRNPYSLGHTDLTQQPSSYPEYLGNRSTKWVEPDEILSYFSKTNPTLSYSAFVEQTDDFSHIAEALLDTHDWASTETRPGGPPVKVVRPGFLKRLFDI